MNLRSQYEIRHAGMDCRRPARRMRPETSMSTWVPAIHPEVNRNQRFRLRLCNNSKDKR